MNKNTMIAALAIIAMIFAFSSCGQPAITDSGGGSSNNSSTTGGDSNSGGGSTSGGTDGVNNGAGGSTDGTNNGNNTGGGTGGANDGDNATVEGGNVAWFEDEGSISVKLVEGAVSGSGNEVFEIQSLRDEALEKNANLATLLVSDLQVSVDASSVGALSALGGTSFLLDISYQLPGKEKIRIGYTNTRTHATITQLISGISMDDNTIWYDLDGYDSFVDALVDESNSTLTMIVDVKEISPALSGTGSFTLKYVVKGNAQVRL